MALILKKFQAKQHRSQFLLGWETLETSLSSKMARHKVTGTLPPQDLNKFSGLDLLKLNLNVGAFLHIMPSYKCLQDQNCNKSIKEKCCAVIAILLLTAYRISSSFYLAPLYNDFGQIKLVINILMDIVSFIFCYHIIIGMVFNKRGSWTELIMNLRNTSEINVKCENLFNLKYYWEFAIIQIAFLSIHGFYFYVWFKILGLEFYYTFLIRFILFYFIYHYTATMCILLKLILIRFKYLNQLLAAKTRSISSPTLSTSIDFIALIAKVQSFYQILKDIVRNFNDIFGTSIFLIIFYSSMVLLNYLDDIFKDSYGYQSVSTAEIIVCNLAIVILSFTAAGVLILRCDSVLEEANELIANCYNLRRHFFDISSQERYELNRFIEFCLHHFPSFSGAGFITITKSTIFHILGTSTTYLIVVIQFNAVSNTESLPKVPVTIGSMLRNTTHGKT